MVALNLMEHGTGHYRRSERTNRVVHRRRSVLMMKAGSTCHLRPLGRRGAAVRVGGCSSKSGAWLPVSQGLKIQNAVRGCLVREMKIFRCHIGCFGDVGRGFRILIKKLIT